ncbi:MAG: ThiF family adenylyltransferase [Acidobacteriota bacterium]
MSILTTNTRQPDIKDRFARIEPIVGNTLCSRRITLLAGMGSAYLLEYLVSCGVSQFNILVSDNERKNKQQTEETIAELSKRLALEIKSSFYDLDTNVERWASRESSLFLGTGGEVEYELLREAVIYTGRPAIFYRTVAMEVGLLFFLLPGEAIHIPDWVFAGSAWPNVDLFSELNLINVVANFAKGLLLVGTEYERRDIEKVLAGGARTLLVGHPSWPWTVLPIVLPSETPFTQLSELSAKPGSLAGHTCLVIGLGSLGSVAAATLARLGANLILVDGKEVAAANPIRQIYGFEDVGRPKAEACAAWLTRLCGGQWHQESAASHWIWRNQEQYFLGYQGQITPESDNLAKLAKLIAEYRPEVALIATGTDNDRAISQLLRTSAIPHVIVSCYARARFFEAITVSRKDGPCYGCVRGHLHLGTRPSLTPEQQARYISSDHELNAEPATRIETARAADLAAQIVYGLLRPEAAAWLTRACAEEQTFFLGGNVVEAQPNGELAYGIEWPGEVRLYGLQDIVGRGAYLECWDCGRQLPVCVQYQENRSFSAGKD